MFNIVITMGGMGSRFTKAGYPQPKYMITVKGKTLFEWSLLSLKKFITKENKFIFIVKASDDAQQFILEQSRLLGIPNSHIVEIDRLTDGQATTVLFADEIWEPNAPLIIYNIDTHINPEALGPQDFNGDGWIPCFKAPGESWSFVRLDSQGHAVEVREKRRISENATIGLYGFSSATLYKNLYNKYYLYESNIEKGEKYIAPLYNQLISDGGLVTITILINNYVHVIGTPEELEFFRQSTYSIQ
jgi:NDP-sugar pyrophosphorylase family protein